MIDTSWLGPPIDVRPLLAEQQVAFIDLLRDRRLATAALQIVSIIWSPPSP